MSWNGDVPVIGAPVAAATPVTRPSGEGSATIWYRVRNEASGKVMSIDRAAAANGAAIWQFTNLNNTDQLWSLDPVDGAWLKLASNYNANVVDVAGHSTAPGVAVNTYPYKATHNQQWLLVPGTTQHVGIRNRNSGLMLDNRDGSGRTKYARRSYCELGALT
ncbi:RICIN domain-containing protein [Massilia sp. CCM 8734]|uniref:RICIN domain-containing protein n=1 Tax=Massilia sp. CCM 8734 TaxID=2609283 RepID=UPI001AAF77EC